MEEKNREMYFKHSDNAIEKLQCKTTDTVSDGLKLNYDDTLYGEFTKNYTEMYRKIKQADPLLDEEVSEIIIRNARGKTNQRPCIMAEFANKHFVQSYGGFIHHIDELTSSRQIVRVPRAADESDGVYSKNLPTKLDDSKFKCEINGTSWSWEEVVMLLRHANSQLYG